MRATSPEVEHRYNVSEKGRARRRRYNATEKSRQARARYEATPRGQVTRVLKDIRYGAKRRVQ